MKFFGTLYSLYPRFEKDFLRIEEILDMHYRVRLETVDWPPAIPDASEIQEALTNLKNFILERRTTEETVGKKFPVASMTRSVLSMLRFLRSAYLVKSASLLEGFIWSINQKNGFITAISLRQEIELLAMTNLAIEVIRPKDFEDVNWMRSLFRLVSGRRPHQSDPAGGSELGKEPKAFNVSRAVARFDKNEATNTRSPWLGECYAWLSEIVHPNRDSNLLHFGESQHFWKLNYKRNPEILGRFLSDGSRIFARTIDDIGRLPTEGEVGFIITRGN